MNNLINMNEVQTLDLSKLKNAALKKEGESLSALQSKIASGLFNAVTSVEAIRREQAVILARIAGTELYKKDGFKSLAEFGETIGLGKATTHALANAGKVYLDKKAPDELKEMTPSNLAALNSALNSNKEQVYKDAQSGAFKGKTQKEIKKYAAESKPVKGKIVKTYLPCTRTADGLVERMDEDENGEKPYMPNTADGWLDYYSNPYSEAQFISADEDGNKRIVVIWKDGTSYIVTLKEYKPTNNKAKTTTGKAEFLARAAKEGMSDDQIRVVLKVMGW